METRFYFEDIESELFLQVPQEVCYIVASIESVPIEEYLRVVFVNGFIVVLLFF